MAIVPLDKMTLYGSESQREAVVERLQELGCVHLIDLASAGDGPAPVEHTNDTRDALRFLRRCPEKRRQNRRAENFDREDVVAAVLALKRRKETLSDEHGRLRKAIETLEPWGEFQLPADATIGGIRFWFYVVPLRSAEDIQSISLPWSEVRRDHRSLYVVVLSRDEPQDVPGTRVDLDARPLSELKRQLEEIEEQLEDVHHERAGLTRWCTLLAGALDQADDIAAREHAVRQVCHGDRVFALQGWIPRAAAERIRRFAAENQLAVTIEPPAPGEEPPTLLHNPEPLSGSEALVTFYKMPEYRSWDPSIVAYISFAVFFAMILADAGYGLILALGTAYLWKGMGKTASGRRGRNVLATICGCCIVYGVMCGSYFGVTPPSNSLPEHLHVLDAQSQAIMMPLTIVIGVIHLSVANVATAWLQRGRAQALASLGWIAVMFGGILAGIAAFGDISETTADLIAQNGRIVLLAGLAAVFLFSSTRPLRSLSFKTHMLRAVDGLRGLSGLSALFGDVLSYLRLFALGLSGAKLSATFNELGASAWDSAGFGVIAAIAIVVLGHALNLALGIMSGVVHGLRLNCIEFFKWSLPEDGYSFKAFAKKASQS